MKLLITQITKVFLMTYVAISLFACSSHKHQSQDTALDDSYLNDDNYSYNTNQNNTGYIENGLQGTPVLDNDSTNNTNYSTIFYFDFNEDRLTSEARRSLDWHAQRMQGQGSKVRLEGHADEQGSRQFNMALGERRAKAVAGYLVSLGVSRNRFEIVSYGEEKPIANSFSESAHAQNRRVEMKK
jgi:peptidoglycan-associated lipoprotein